MDLNWTLSIGNLLSALIIALGWIVAYRLNSEKDLRNKKREMRTQYLMSAYTSIADQCGRKQSPDVRALERAGDQIQFLGTKKQIQLLFEGNEAKEYSALLKELRKDIRKELELEIFDINIKHLRYD